MFGPGQCCGYVRMLMRLGERCHPIVPIQVPHVNVNGGSRPAGSTPPAMAALAGHGRRLAHPPVARPGQPVRTNLSSSMTAPHQPCLGLSR